MGKDKIANQLTDEDCKIIKASMSKQDQIPEQIKHQTLTEKWPDPLAPEAFHGLAGDIVKAIEPHTEADPAALLISFKVLYGNVIGRQAHFTAEADKHYLNLFACLVGTTSKGRKGVSLRQVKQFFQSDEQWARDRITHGMSSGEGLIWAVRDEQRELKRHKKGEEVEIITVDGVDDKRLVVIESEFASTIRVLRREGNTLSAIVRKAWDDGNLQALTKNSPAKATEAHISILGHITKDELLRFLDNTEAANGFGNRFLWFCVSRSKCLPEGGQLQAVDFSSIVERLTDAVKFGRQTGEIKRDDQARLLWCDIYPDLSEGKPGLTGSMLARSEAQVMRMACIYALLDLSNVVRTEHLTAALAVWDYVEASARFIFGNSIGDPLADEIKEVLKKAGEDGMTKTEIHNHFGRHKKTKDINRALNVLAERGITRFVKLTDTGGRTAEKWFINKVAN